MPSKLFDPSYAGSYIALRRDGALTLEARRNLTTQAGRHNLGTTGFGHHRCWARSVGPHNPARGALVPDLCACFVFCPSGLSGLAGLAGLACLLFLLCLSSPCVLSGLSACRSVCLLVCLMSMCACADDGRLRAHLRCGRPPRCRRPWSRATPTGTPGEERSTALESLRVGADP